MDRSLNSIDNTSIIIKVKVFSNSNQKEVILYSVPSSANLTIVKVSCSILMRD